MKTCPKCKAEISYLIVRQLIVDVSEVELSEDGGFEYIDGQFEDYKSENYPQYLCPKCSEVLTMKEDEAIKIMKGEPIDGS